MNKVFSLFIIIPILLFGCKSNVVEEFNHKQRIEDLNMDIYSDEGNKIYSIKSPISYYDLEKQPLNLGSTNIQLFYDQDSKYIIKSDKSKLSNNNNVLELIGNIEINTITEGEKIYANKFLWNINDSNFILEGNVEIDNNNINLYSYKAILGTDNIIEFFNPVKYIIKNDNNEKNYEINAENAYYNIKTKSVSFSSKEERVRSILSF